MKVSQTLSLGVLKNFHLSFVLLLWHTILISFIIRCARVPNRLRLHFVLQVANLNDKYETPKDLVNHKPLKSILSKNQKLKNRLVNFPSGVHVNTLESNPLDVVYSDPKDSKLYQIPGAEAKPASEDAQPYKVYMSEASAAPREDQYCRPYVTMRPPSSFMQQTSGMYRVRKQNS